MARKTFHDRAIRKGYVKKTPSHLTFRSFVYKLIGLVFIIHTTWMIAGSL